LMFGCLLLACFNIAGLRSRPSTEYNRFSYVM
jgi:hypothetical protein